MKLMSFAVFAMSGLLAASFVYVAPAMADDTTIDGQPMQNLADSNTVQSSNAPSSNPTGEMSNDMNNSNTNLSANTNNPSATTGSGDEGTPDTATGDDDY